MTKVSGKTSTKADFVTKANTFIEGVMSGEVPACKQVIAACERQKKDLERQHDENFAYVFDAAKANRVCMFISNLQHVKGELAGQKIKLEPWQCFIICVVFGWSGGKLLVSASYKDAKVKAAEMKESRKKGGTGLELGEGPAADDAAE